MRLLLKNTSLFLSILILFSSIFTSHIAKAQLFGGDQNPLSVNWRQISTGGFKLIYPVEMEAEAQRMANTIPHIFPAVGSSLSVRKTTLPIVFQNQGVIANGFVQLGPKKSEFNTTPPQQYDSQDWLNNLAVHELRHAAQFDLLTSGRPYPFPEQVYFALMGAGIPLWYFEGDAVSTETSLTLSGRGRQPSWIMPYRTALLQGKSISYSKANFGSDKDVTPGYYQLGYLLASGIRAAAGKYVFDSVLTDMKKHPFRLYPFAGSLKKFSGKTGKEWYTQTTTQLKADWERQAAQTPSEDYPVLNAATRIATDYFLPVQLPDGNILALKQSKAEPAAFVLINAAKQEKKIKRIGQQETPWFSYAKGSIVWDEVRYDPRYRQRSYSVICRYDLKTGKYKQLSSRSRIFSPTLSADGAVIAAVNVSLSNMANLILMDAATGQVIRSFENPQHHMIQMPSFHSSGKILTYVSVTEAGKALYTVTLDGKYTKIIKETRQQLSRPVFIGDKIAFNAHYSGIDNIYEVSPGNGKTSALSAAKYGAFNPSRIPGTDSILFNTYGLNGYEISRAAIRPGEKGKDHFVFYGDAAARQENTGTVFSHIPDSLFSSAPYPKLGRLFNFHSVIPVIDDAQRGGLQLVSNNLLNTMDAYAGIDYQSDLGRFEYNAGATLRAFYPVFSLNYRNRPRRAFYNTMQGIQSGDWREHYVKLNASLPLNFSSTNHNYSLSLRAGTSFTQRYDALHMPSNFLTTLRFPLETGITIGHSLRAAERDIAPEWAQILRFTYLSQPFDRQLSGNLFAAESFFYFPGFARNHTFLANFSMQESSGIRIYTNEINTVYGYNNIPAKSRLRNTLLLNYRFPFWFPDAELGPLAYIRNVRAGVFCGYENLGYDSNLGQPKTYGLEFHSAMHVLRYQPLLDLGTRFVFVNPSYHHDPVFEVNVTYTF